METPAQKLCGRVNKKYLLFVKRGNTAIKIALALVSMKGRKKVLIQDQGGWLTYPQFIKKLKMEKVELKTDYGLIYPDELKNNKDSVLLINSMPGYNALEDMEIVEEECKNNNIFLLNDVSGSIGTDCAKYGDVIFGSFGNAKPINIGSGAFVATDDEKLYKEFCKMNTFIPDDKFMDELGKKLKGLNNRLLFFHIKRTEVIEHLKGFEIVHPNGNGINVIVKFDNDDGKNEIENYCNEQNLEFTLCPRYIRINEPAVSIEIKRLEESDDMENDEENDEVE